ncbi:D-2-hydroxyacid dehydrogenase [uncultured Roseobacter sp.]|uniref:D-2-hydroxyacid dehydrogenase n=1 Tax=uncultured Roseobacter sp. TaxID=114847 RepID=UPI002608BD86|nr:D-2-hydroxyacid dehydrogenase [uncultured Roseobacter sp.]
MKVIVHAQETEALVAQLRDAHPDIHISACQTYTDLPAMIETESPDAVYSIRFDSTSTYPADALLGPGGPDWIAVGGSGIDHLGHWDPAKTTVTNAAGVAAEMMAEYAFGSFLHFSLDISGLQRDKERRVWASRLMSPLRGKTLLIIGLGHTGSAVAQLGKAFGMKTLGTRARPAPMPNVDEVYAPGELPRLCQQADYVLVSTPLVASTRNLVDASLFDVMKPGVVLVDVSRGGVINSKDLLDALRQGKISGAALDVFETEPLPADSAFWELPNILISPHCSSVFAEWDAASMNLFCENLTRWQKGEPLKNIVDPVRGY